MNEKVSRRTVMRSAAAVTGLLGLEQLRGAPAVGAVKVPAIEGVVNSSSGLNLHSAPGVDQPVVRWLENGTPVTIRETSGDWFRVETGQATGWASSWYVVLHGTPSNMIVQGDATQNRVALTFDCGSDFGYTNQILSTLANHEVAASFGLTGEWVRNNPEGAKKIASRGYQLINHTLDHPSFTGLSTPGTGPSSPAKRLAQIQANEALIRKVTGKRTRPYWRPPFGDIDDSVLRDVGALGFSQTTLWTIDSFGWNGLTAQEIYDWVMANIVPGAIVLMHVGAQSQDANAIDRIIRSLKSMDYRFVTVAGMIN